MNPQLKQLWIILILVQLLSPGVGGQPSLSCQKDPNQDKQHDEDNDDICPAASPLEKMDLGVEQAEQDSPQVARILEQTRDYMHEHTSNGRFTSQVIRDCKNRHELCSFWALGRHCEHNPIYMNEHCGPSCRNCEWHDLLLRCPFNTSDDVLKKPGDLNAIFERITTNPYYLEHYEPTILSRPTYVGDGPLNTSYAVGPWVLLFDNVLSEEDCQTFIEHGTQAGFSGSQEILEDRLDGTFTTGPVDGRKSTNAWCTSPACMGDPVTHAMEQKVVNLTGIRDGNFEHFQILRYLPGESYAPHNDYKIFMNARQSGQRILTFLIYLNNVTAGGETHFPELNLTIVPKAGRAILWPSVLDSSPTERENRALHTALEVKHGVKYAINTWIHLRDFKKPREIGC